MKLKLEAGGEGEGLLCRIGGSRPAGEGLKTEEGGEADAEWSERGGGPPAAAPLLQLLLLRARGLQVACSGVVGGGTDNDGVYREILSGRGGAAAAQDVYDMGDCGSGGVGGGGQREERSMEMFFFFVEKSEQRPLL
jgi:hypothetical protein